MNTLSRLWRHLKTTAGTGRRAFPQEVLDAIQQTIAEGERLHRAEVRVIIETSLTLGQVLKGETSRMRARTLFSEHRIWDTEENTGVLIYVLLADHKVEIITDRAVGRALTPQEWQGVCRTMTEDFRRGDYRHGAVSALEQLNALLHERFPDDGSRANQLSDHPVVL